MTMTTEKTKLCIGLYHCFFSLVPCYSSELVKVLSEGSCVSACRAAYSFSGLFWFLTAAVGVVEEATQVVGAAVERTVEVAVWVFLLLFPRHLLPVSIQVNGNWLFLFLTQH